MRELSAEFLISIDNDDLIIILEVEGLNDIECKRCYLLNNNINVDLESGDVIYLGPLSDNQLSKIRDKKMPFVLMNTNLNLILDVQLIHVDKH